MKQGVYKIMNVINDKCYIGSTINLHCRWIAHKSKLNSGKHGNKHLQSAWNLYGKDCFIFIILEEILNPTREMFANREQYWVNTIRPEYNMRKVVESNLGITLSAETKSKISLANKGRKFSDEHRSNLSKASKGKAASPLKLISIRKPRSEKAKQNMRLGHKDSFGEKNSFYGRKHTLEWKIKRSELMKNKWNNKEYREKMMEL